MTDKKTPAGGNRRGGAEKGLGGAISASYDSTFPTQTQPGIAGLAAAGVEFTLPQRGDKQPSTKGWPSYRPDLATVAKHLSRGGNLGVHVKGYTDGWCMVAFDGDYSAGMDALLRAGPELAGSLRSWRASGSGKILVWVQDPDGLLRNQTTQDLAGPHTKLQLLTSGSATIHGLHPSGQRYETNWAAPITLTVDQVIAIWEQWSGQPWAEGRKRATVEPGQGYTRNDGGDVDRVKAAWTPTGVFAHHWPGVELIKESGGEVRIRGRGGLHCNDTAGLWHSFADDRGGDVISAWAYATGRDEVTDFPAILREMAAAAGIVLAPRPTRRDGDTGHTDPDDGGGAMGSGGIVGKINRLRLGLRSVDFAEIVPLELQSVKGYRTGDRDRLVADTALGYLWELRTLEARISNLELSVRTGYSVNACRDAMRRLVRIFQPMPDENERGKMAVRYTIEGGALDRHTNNSGEEVCQSSALPLATHRAHDVFTRSLSALTPETLAEIDEKRHTEGIAPMRRNRQLAARLTAKADALGPAALRLVDALAMYGGLSGEHLAAVLQKSPTAARRVVTRAIDAGLVVETDGGAFALADTWSDRVDALDKIVPTAGTVARRALFAADSRLRYCDSALTTKTDAVKAESLRRRRAAAAKAKEALIHASVIAYNERQAAAGWSGVSMDAALKPGRGETFADWQRRQTFDAQIGDQAIREFAQTLAGLDRETAEQTAYFAGYSPFEFAQSWALRAIV